MVSEAGEEDAATEQGDLQGLDVEVYAIGVPGVGSEGQGNERGECPVEVGEEEDGEDERADAVAEEDAK